MKSLILYKSQACTIMRLTLLLLLIPPTLPAQSLALKDPDIVWAAEIEQDWIIDIPSLEDEWEQGVITLKQLRCRENELNWSSPYLAELVFEAVQNGKLAVFKDPDCSTFAGDFLAYQNVESGVTFDPVTYDEQIFSVREGVKPLADIKAWRLRQILTYHKKSGMWSTSVVAMAPLIIVRDSKGDSLYTRPLFWFKPDNKPHKLGAARISWAKKTFSGNQPGTEIPANPLHLIKVIPGFENPMEDQLKKLGADQKLAFYDSQGNKLLSAEARREMLTKIDTIAVFDPETHKESIQIEYKGAKTSDFSQLRLVQTWYWDARRARLSIHLDAVAPTEKVIDPNGYFRYMKPLFYRSSKRTN
jgi:hypothetical protein